MVEAVVPNAKHYGIRTHDTRIHATGFAPLRRAPTNSALHCLVCVLNFTVCKLINANRSLSLASPPSNPVAVHCNIKSVLHGTPCGTDFGRGDGIRTHDLMVPNHTRYQLRYASNENFDA